ncbi:hypothetical protein BDR05DRAFT_952768 [Suillus weaverae]|nr:hypothetical protein BDR05DRAFT_952768 [Suillus weaverae]
MRFINELFPTPISPKTMKFCGGFKTLWTDPVFPDFDFIPLALDYQHTKLKTEYRCKNLTPATASTSISDGETNFWESSKPAPADESPNSSLQVMSYQPSSPDWPRGDVTDAEYSSGEGDTSRWRWTGFSPAYKSRKRHLEVEEEANSPEDSPRKKFKETPPSPLDNAMDQDHDSDEEYEVENALLL